MTGVSSAIPTIAQTLQSLNSPQVPNIKIGTANPDAGAMAAPVVVPSAGSVGSGCGSSIDTYA